MLGGTESAGVLSRALAERGIPGVYSYAGRTATPAPQPLPVRVGGFGGPDGLAAYIGREGITHVVDATHPFAVAISRNAVAACAATGAALIALERPPWTPGPGDDWRGVPDLDAAVAALPGRPAGVFLAIGRQDAHRFAARPEHRYLLRLVDPGPPPLAGAAVVVERGPFTAAGDRALMEAHGIALVVAKNAGGSGARAKLDAARALGLPVVMVARPALPSRATTDSVATALAWLAHEADRGV